MTLGPTTAGTATILAALLLAASTLGDEFASPGVVARNIASIVGCGLALSLVLDAQQGLRNLVRTDLVCLLSLYGLILVERFSLDANFDTVNSINALESGIILTLWAFGGIAVGRHLVSYNHNRNAVVEEIELPIRMLYGITVAAFLVSVLHILLSTKFDLGRIWDGLIGPRFARPWTRGRLGGWHTLLNELSLLFYLIPPLCAILATRWRECSWFQLAAVSVIGGFTFFEAFAGGTRNIFLTHLISFSACFILLSRQLTLSRLALIGSIVISIAGLASHQMLEFRQMGLQRYITNQVYSSGEARDSLFVDDNLSSISQLSAVFPDQYPHLGWEIPYWAIIKPIPRALWPGKPEGLSISIEQALNGDEAYTIATTYIGEAYMAFGKIGVIVTSLFFGCLASYWNRFAGAKGGSMGVVIFSSGFFAAAITMRSLVWLTTAILPTVALLVFWHFYLKPRMSPPVLSGRAPLRTS